MCAKRSDGIEEEPFELDEEPPQRAAPQRKAPPARAQQAATRAPVEEEYPPEEEEPPEGEEEFEEAGPPAGGIAGLSPQTIKLIAIGVVVLAAVGILAALVLRSSSRRNPASI